MTLPSSDSAGGDVHLVGSLPFDSAEAAMRTTATQLAGLLSSIPDGEVGERRNWVRYLPLRIYSCHPQLIETSNPDTASILQSGDTHTTAAKPAAWTFSIRPGESLVFDDLHYGTFAIDSYRVFSKLRAEGVIPEGVRFQVSIPAPGSAINPFFGESDQWEVAHRAFEAGVRNEIDKMLGVIPEKDLLIQWDLAWEVVDLASGEEAFYEFWPHDSITAKFERHIRVLDELWKGIPDEVRFGYHWCYGTRGGWPMTVMTDLALCVALSNEAVRRSARRVDFVHMPVVRHPGDNFFAPLGDLEIGQTRLYLGLVHHTDDTAAFIARRDQARRYVDDFGISSVCGYGRVSPAELNAALAAHRLCAAAMDT